MPNSPTVSIVIVHWNTADLLAACLGSIRRFAPECEVLVVDNASTDGSCERVRREFPGVKLLAQSANLGFARANNVGLREARGRYLLLLNPDTELREGAVASLVGLLDAKPAAGIAGPPLWNPDGTLQPSVRPFPSLGQEFLLQTMLFRVLPNRVRSEGARRDSRRVPTVSGAALCIRRECLDAIGLLDEGIFMFYEDTDLCRRAHDAGWETWFVDGPGVLHHKGAASAGPERTRILLASLRGAVHYFRKHQGEGAVRGLRAVTLAGAAIRALRALALLAAGVERDDQRARLRAYAAMARWALRGGALRP